MAQSVTIVIPTYNERENIGPLLDALLGLGLPDLSILVVDDSSPDRTADVVLDRAAKDPRVTLLARPRKEGLGRAYTAAFAALLPRRSGTDEPPQAIVQMDADFSHNPSDIPRLLGALAHADLAIGSRYLPGGGTVNWAAGRRILSRGANAYAQLLTGAPIADLTGGFNAWRATTLAAVHAETIRAEGYGYLVELKVRAARQGARIRELPIIFTERRVGRSKLSRLVIWEAAGVVLRLGAQRIAPH